MIFPEFSNSHPLKFQKRNKFQNLQEKENLNFEKNLVRKNLF